MPFRSENILRVDLGRAEKKVRELESELADLISLVKEYLSDIENEEVKQKLTRIVNER